MFYVITYSIQFCSPSMSDAVIIAPSHASLETGSVFMTFLFVWAVFTQMGNAPMTPSVSFPWFAGSRVNRLVIVSAFFKFPSLVPPPPFPFDVYIISICFCIICICCTNWFVVEGWFIANIFTSAGSMLFEVSSWACPWPLNIGGIFGGIFIDLPC